MQAKLEERLQTLRDALADSQDIRANLDMLLRWLDQAERETHKLDKGTLVRVQREPLRDVLEHQQVSCSVHLEINIKTCGHSFKLAFSKSEILQ